MAERRLCSVLFCDVVGFTPLSEARDPQAGIPLFAMETVCSLIDRDIIQPIEGATSQIRLSR